MSEAHEDIIPEPVVPREEAAAGEARAPQAEQQNTGDGFFSQRAATPPPPKKSVISGCFWALIIGAGVLVLTITAAVLILVIGGMSMLKGAFNNFSIESSGLARQTRYQESFLMGRQQSRNRIVVVNVQGVITGGEEGGFGGGHIASAPAIVNKLRYLIKDETVKAVIIRVDSPGGEVTASDEIYSMVCRLRNERKIPVVASMGSLAASGGYYVAVGCDYIIAHRMTTTGSIGVIIQTFKYYDLFQKIGVRGEAFTSGKMKDMLSGERPTTPEEQALTQKLVMTVYGDFVGVVAKGRKQLTTEKIRNTIIGDGRVFLGVQALELGLVDQLGYFEDAVKKSAQLAKLGDDYKVVTLNPPFSLASLFGQIEAGGGRNLNIQLPGAGNGFHMEQGRVYLLPAGFSETR